MHYTENGILATTRHGGRKEGWKETGKMEEFYIMHGSTELLKAFALYILQRQHTFTVQRANAIKNI